MDSIINLGHLQEDEEGHIERIEINDEDVSLRLMEIGFTRGTKIMTYKRSPFGSTKSFVVKGTIIGLREQEYNKIYVSR